MIPYEKWPDPMFVGVEEYSAIHKWIGGVLANRGGKPQDEIILTEGCLKQIVSWANRLLTVGTDSLSCPKCLSRDISINSTDGDELNLWEYCACNKCKSEWRNDYKIVNQVYMTEDEDD